MSDKVIVKKVTVPKETEPSEIYYDDKNMAILFEKNKRMRKNETNK